MSAALASLSTRAGLGSEYPAAAFDDRAYLAERYRTLLAMPQDTESSLRGVVQSTLENPGSLARAMLAFRIAAYMGIASERGGEMAIAIEYFHTASLLLDDLPSMDDASERRGRTCAHLIYGEASTILGSLAFINQAYTLIWRYIAGLPRANVAVAAQTVSACLGAAGVVGGQALDLRFAQRQGGEGAVLKIAAAKTVPLIRLPLLLPALDGGADRAVLDGLDELATLWGLSYQILDDFKDEVMTMAETGKDTRVDLALGRPNLPQGTGHGHAMTRLSILLLEAEEVVATLQSRDVRWACLDEFQCVLVAKRDTVKALLQRRFGS